MSATQTQTLTDTLYESIIKLATDKDISTSDAIIEILTPTALPNGSANPYAQLHTQIEEHSKFTPESLKEELLDAIERADPCYEATMTEALTEAIEDIDDKPTMSADEFREWLTDL